MQKLSRKAKSKLNYKQNLVPKEAKGKYNVTIPSPYEFQKKTEKVKTIREQKLEEMLEDKEKEIQELKAY